MLFTRQTHEVILKLATKKIFNKRILFESLALLVAIVEKPWNELVWILMLIVVKNDVTLLNCLVNLFAAFREDALAFFILLNASE